MKILVLTKVGRQDVSYIVYQTSNSFGDQILELRITDKKGNWFYHVETFPEGNWAQFTESAMRDIFAAFLADNAAIELFTKKESQEIIPLAPNG